LCGAGMCCNTADRSGVERPLVGVTVEKLPRRCCDWGSGMNRCPWPTAALADAACMLCEGIMPTCAMACGGDSSIIIGEDNGITAAEVECIGLETVEVLSASAPPMLLLPCAGEARN